MSTKKFIAISPDFNILNYGDSIVYQNGQWVPANYLSANTFESQISFDINTSGNITGNTIYANNVSVTSISATTFYGSLDWLYITSKPSTITGYGITDVYTKTESDNRYVAKSGDTINGQITIYDNGLALHVVGSATISGDLYVSGTTTYINTENLNVTDNIITVNYNEPSSGVSLGSAGIRVDRGYYDDYFFMFDEVRDAFVIGMGTGETAGDISSLQVVATREDEPIINGIAIWNTTTRRFDTTSSFIFENDTLKVTNIITEYNITANTFYGEFVGTLLTDNLDVNNLTASTIYLNTQNIQNLFVSKTGDTMSGQLSFSSGGIEIQTANEGIILKSQNGNRYKITIDDDGYLITTPLAV